MKVKVIGAGSIGNHLAQASRRMGWDVVVVDTDPAALQRMRDDIYPKRYGAWDNTIQLVTPDQEPKGGFDVIFIGTPPDVRMKLALAALEEKPRLLHLEKPLCTPLLEGLDEFLSAVSGQKDTAVLVGYDHAVAESIEHVESLIRAGTVGTIETLDVEFREDWAGIFAVHPWLAGPQDSYLGYWRRGGGTGGEHSHAMHLWRHLAKISGLGQWKYGSVAMEFQSENGTDYDSIAAFLFVTDRNKVGRVVQDVITKPFRKWAKIQGSAGVIEWYCNGSPEGDIVKVFKDGNWQETLFAKKRPDDFYRETLHIQKVLEGEISAAESPLSLESGVEVIRVLHAAHGIHGRGSFDIQ